MKRSLLVAPFIAVVCSGCSVISITASSVGSKVAPTLALENRAAPHKSVLVHGFLERTPEDLEHNVLVVAATPQGELASTVSVGKSGMYSLFAPPGEFLISAFVDRNDDGVIKPEEIAGQTTEAIGVTPGTTRALVGVDVFFVDTSKSKPKFAPVLNDDINLDEGIPSLEPASDLFSPRFGDENIRLGSDESTTAFFNQANPLQYLDEIDLTDGKTPLVFVHGINDSPRIFDRFENKVPAGHFEALYYFYPTGARLPFAAQLLHHLFLSGKVLPTSKELVLVAHSMGGLVARGSLNELKGESGESQVRLYSSFATPYGGVVAANFATTSSPAIVPSWIDVASKSDYVRDLFQPLPPATIFELCAANKYGNGDGVIALESQKAPRATAQARNVTEFPDTHVGITEDPAAIDQLFVWARELASPTSDGQDPLAQERREHPGAPLGNIERLRRARLLLNAVLREAEIGQLDLRISVIAPTVFRFKFIGSHSSLELQASAGEGLRFDLPAEAKPLLLEAWPSEEQALQQTVANLVHATLGRLESMPARVPVLGDSPAKAFPSQTQPTRKAPPFALGTGLSINLDPGAQDFALVTPFFMDMYLGAFGLGLDARITVLAPIEQTPTANIKYQPFYLLSGPRIRFGGADTLFTGKFSLNAGAEFGRMTLSDPGDPVRVVSPDEVIRYDGIARFIATTAIGLGIRIRPDFYAITQFEAGARPSPIDVDVGAADPLRLNDQIFGNLRIGVEIRVP